MKTFRAVLIITMMPMQLAFAGVDFKWFEITPFEVGSEEAIKGGVFAQTPDVGKNFSGGVAQSGPYGNAPVEYPLFYWLGAAGSAFEIGPEYFDKGSLGFFKQGAYQLGVDIGLVGTEGKQADTKRLYPVQVRNFARFLNGKPSTPDEVQAVCGTEYLNCGNMVFIDAGISGANIPFSGLGANTVPAAGPARRRADIIFAFDGSADVASKNGLNESLEVANQYIDQGRLNLLKFDTQYFNQQGVAVVNDPRTSGYDKTKPVVIYLPFNNDFCAGSWCSTFNFLYETDQSGKVIETTRGLITSIQKDIKEILSAWHQKNAQ